MMNKNLWSHKFSPYTLIRSVFTPYTLCLLQMVHLETYINAYSKSLCKCLKHLDIFVSVMSLFCFVLFECLKFTWVKSMWLPEITSHIRTFLRVFVFAHLVCFSLRAWARHSVHALAAPISLSSSHRESSGAGVLCVRVHEPACARAPGRLCAVV